ncbi:MAG: tRNA 4-thiouridine(8) synthase ThiI [Christensenellaceae bacterium]|jgi:thiamine biosynthesis protein ThiI|nr:tRNA 4-thiouridine(8) synthase ThiI [Christensenellaceae bacterium]
MQVILVRYGEIHLKGLNRPFFEHKLIEGIKSALKDMGREVKVRQEQGRFYIFGVPKDRQGEAIARLTRVFGIHSLSPAVAVEKEYSAIWSAVRELVAHQLEGKASATFKCFCRRSDKRFPLRSEDLNRELGHDLLEAFPQLQVDVHNPEIKVCVEIREQAFIYTDEIMGADGMPTGTAGRAALLISGGIDSPVAGYMMAKRGLQLSAVHFYSYPYTSERARDKVVELTKLISRYAGKITLHLVPFTEIQLTIYETCPPKETTVLMRRLMMRIAEQWAKLDGALALITGEALGQVASQTIESLCVTDDAVSMPVFRPLIGFDKEEIITVAKKIGTFETSILPFEDCCTVFVPQHPVTKPDVARLRKSEAMADWSDMVQKALDNTETMQINSR